MRRGIALSGVSLGYFMVLLDMTVLAVAEPDVARALHASVAGLQWTTTGYTVVFGALLLSAGAVADRYGAHRVFRAGVAAFGLLSLLCAAAPTVSALVALRVLQGAAAAACVPASLALIARLYPDPARRTRAIGTWAAISGAAVAVGPVVGGLLVDAFGWRAVFVVNAPITVLVLVLASGAFLRCPATDRPVQAAAQVVLGVAMAAGTDAVIAAGRASWLHAGGAAAVAMLAVAVFARRERTGSTPVLPRELLAGPGIPAGLFVGAAVNFTLNGTLFVLPLLLVQDRHLDAAGTGLRLLPLTLPFVVNPPLTGRLVSRFGPRPPVLTGLGLLAAGSAGLAWVAWSTAGDGWLAAALLVVGVGVSLVLPAVVAVVLSAAPPAAAGAGSGLLNAARQLGATAGVAMMGALLHTGVRTGAGGALFLAAVVCAVAAAWFGFGGRRRGGPENRTRFDQGRLPRTPWRSSPGR
ncbi:MFS transporter [Actinoplanes sp. SE50]|nr:major facilitator superfamily MFS_1 [Actinoplanes sp. SE50/110]ATO83178.1 MFS transporter [Actinoplanes sp. SE50]SLM00585.1 MFS transporter [Actinoplanes sp. SE50/110]